MIFPRKAWLEIFQEEVEKAMGWELYPDPETQDCERIMRVIIARIQSAEESTNRIATRILLDYQGLELV